MFDVLKDTKLEYPISPRRTNKSPAQQRQKVKNKPKVLVIGDSHGREIAEKVNEKTMSDLQTTGWIKPGAPLAHFQPLFDSAEIGKLNNKDFVVLFGASKDVYCNN